MVLNDEQRQMVVDNEKLIWWTMKRFGVSDIDDIYSILALGLCKAACTYKKEKGEFSTWAITIMEMEIKLEFRRRNTNIRRLNYETFSYNSIIPNGKNKHDIEFLETIQGKSDVWEDLVNIDFSCLTETEKQIVKLICEGYNQMEMKEIMGLSQSYISRIITRIKKKLGKELYNEL